MRCAVYAQGCIYPDTASGQQPVSTTISQLQKSGFQTVILGLFHIGRDYSIDPPQIMGDIYFNERVIISGGSYVGDSSWPALINGMIGGTVEQVCASVGGGGGVIDFQTIKKHYENNSNSFIGTNLEKNFRVLQKTFPSISIIDMDCEENYDLNSFIAFCQMLIGMGFGVTFCPYNYAPFWTASLSALNTLNPGAVKWWNLQCYAGGRGNNPADWAAAITQTIPGFSTDGFILTGDWTNDSPPVVQTLMGSYKNNPFVGGGFIWTLDEIIKQNPQDPSTLMREYVNAISIGLGDVVLPPVPPLPSDILTPHIERVRSYTDEFAAEIEQGQEKQTSRLGLLVEPSPEEAITQFFNEAGKPNGKGIKREDAIELIGWWKEIEEEAKRYKVDSAEAPSLRIEIKNKVDLLVKQVESKIEKEDGWLFMPFYLFIVLFRVHVLLEWFVRANPWKPDPAGRTNPSADRGKGEKQKECERQADEVSNQIQRHVEVLTDAQVRWPSMDLGPVGPVLGSPPPKPTPTPRPTPTPTGDDVVVLPPVPIAVLPGDDVVVLAPVPIAVQPGDDVVVLPPVPMVERDIQTFDLNVITGGVVVIRLYRYKDPLTGEWVVYDRQTING